MAARLGDVLYWLGCGAAVLFGIAAVGAAAYSPYAGVDNLELLGVSGIMVLFAIGAWLIGRALRYILAG